LVLPEVNQTIYVILPETVPATSSNNVTINTIYHWKTQTTACYPTVNTQPKPVSHYFSFEVITV